MVQRHPNMERASQTTRFKYTGGIVALKSVATLHLHVIFLFCDRFHWRRSFSFWCITSWSLTRIVNGIIIRSTWGSYTWYKWQLGRRGLKTLFKDLHQGEMNMNSETIYVTYNMLEPRHKRTHVLIQSSLWFEF